MFKKFLALTLGLVFAIAGVNPSFAYSNSSTWQGNGASIQDGVLIPGSQQCGPSGDASGNYILWVLTASKANNADIDFDGPGGNAPVAMTKSGGGSFKYVQTFGSTIIPAPSSTIVATYDGPARKATLTISHGCNVVPRPSLSLTKTIDYSAGTPNSVGDTIHYNITVTNTGNVDLADVVLTDNNGTIDDATCRLAAGASHNGLMTVGQSVVCAATHVLTNADFTAGQVDNTATATDDASGATDSDTATLEVEPNPSLTLTKTVDSSFPASEVGDVIHFNIEVTNNGNVDLVDVVLSDTNGDIDGASCRLVAGDGHDGYMTVGQVVTCTATHEITNDDMLAGSVVNTATATDDDSDATDDDTATKYLTATPGIHVTKEIDYTAGIPSAVGETIYYVITVTNTGNVDLSDVVLADPGANLDAGCILVSTDAAYTGDISIGDSVECTGTHVITNADMLAEIYSNTATASSDDEEVSDDDTIDLNLTKSPALSVSKDFDFTEGVPNEVGETIYYVITVTNTGNVDLSDVVLSDPNAVIDAGCILLASDAAYTGFIGIGDSVTCTATHVITNADMVAEGYSNTATASSDSEKLSEEDSADLDLPKAPDLSIDKSIDTDFPADGEGDVIHYIITVTNTGNIDLPDVILVDENAEIDPASCRLVAGALTHDGALAIGESVTCFATHEITAADVEAGYVDNTATASDEANDLTASDSADRDVSNISELVIDKYETSSGPYAVGDDITYTIVVTNTGNTVLSGIEITDTNADLVSCDDALTSLDVADTITCYYAHTVTQADMDNCSVTNVASADANEGDVTDTSDEVETTLPCQDPALSITKSIASVSAFAVNGVITYTIVVSNTSNVTATDVTVSDAFADITSCTPSNGSDLAPGASMTCTATHTITVNNFDSGHYDNYATASSNGGDVNITSNTVSTPFVPNTPGISITKALSGPVPTKAGDIVTFTITVTNTGNVRLDGVEVADANAPISSCSQERPATLEPGASMTCTAAHVVTDADVEAGKVVNVATTSSTTGPVNGTSNEVEVPIKAIPAMTITKALTGPAPILAGDTVTYTLTIKNTGNVKLEGINVTDGNALIGTCSQALPATLAIGASMTCTATHVVTAAEVSNGEVRNVAGASSTTGPTNATSNEVVIPMAKPAIAIRKSITGTAPKKVGDVITYTIVVTNTGNVKLTNVRVIDDNATITSCTKPNPAPELAIGESFSCTATHTVTTADAQAGEVLNVAVATTNENVTANSSAGSAASGSVKSNAVKLVLKLTAGGGTKGGIKNPKYPGLAYTGGESQLKFDDAEFLFVLLATGLIFGIRRRVKARKN